jgi:hypothetical protein
MLPIETTNFIDEASLAMRHVDVPRADHSVATQ